MNVYKCTLYMKSLLLSDEDEESDGCDGAQDNLIILSERVRRKILIKITGKLTQHITHTRPQGFLSFAPRS